MSNVGTIGHEKTFVIPTFGVTATKELTTLMNPISLAVAKETGQFDSVAQERRSAFAEMLFEGYLFRKKLVEAMGGVKAGEISLS